MHKTKEGGKGANRVQKLKEDTAASSVQRPSHKRGR